MPVSSEHRQYQDMKARWKRCRDVYDGEEAVHDGRDDYLPRLKDQHETDYMSYVRRTPFYNATYRTISGLVGMIFRQAPILDVPEPVLEMLNDVTLSGVTLQVLTQTVTSDNLTVGRVGILVDCPEAPLPQSGRPLTLADAATLNIRPTMQLYTAESIINWKTRRINNSEVLTMVVLKEVDAITKDEFEDKLEDQFRVLDLDEGNGFYRVRLFKRENNADVQIGGEIYPLMNGRPMTFIPFVFIGIDDLDPRVDVPPFIDLVDLNLSHYRTMADLEHGAHFTGLPTPVVTGYKKEAGDVFYVGSVTAWMFPDPQTKVSYLEFSGSGLEALEKLLERKEKQMAILGARMLEPQRQQVEAAEGQAIHRKGEESLLAQIASTVSMGVERALKWFVQWAGIAYECHFELNRDFFPAPMQPAELTALVSAWQQGAISDLTLFEKLQQGQVVSEDRTFEEEQELVAETAQRLASMQAELMKQQGLNPDGTPVEEEEVE